MHPISKLLSPTWLVSWGSQISNKRNSAHSMPPIRCFWSAFREENVCTVIPGQSGRRSKSIRRRFVTNSLTSDCPELVFVLVDELRTSPLAEEDCDVVQDIIKASHALQRLWRLPREQSCSVLPLYRQSPKAGPRAVLRWPYLQNNAKLSLAADTRFCFRTSACD